MESNKLQVVKRYFELLESFNTDPSEFTSILHHDMKQQEFPNLLNRNGQESNLTEMLRRTETGKKILSKQSYEIVNVIENQNLMVVETIWQGTMAMDAGPLKSGQELKAYFCIVLEFKDGTIFRQRNYDCFEPFSYS